ncbi:MAG: glycosyltransferase, partial [Candidatus Thermoplasmatota archaeon]|nr:glycosyltransferase [Candidatus Thermoplasmatota archaeon]
MSRIAFLLGYDLLEPKLDRRVLLEAQSCVARGHTVEVLCWARRQPFRELTGSYEGVTFHRLYQKLSAESRPFPLKIPSYLALVRQMLRRLAVFNPDVVIAADLEMLPAAVTGRLFQRYGLIYDSHEDWPAMEAQTNPALGFATKLLERTLLPAVDAVVTVCETLALRFRRRGKECRVLLTARTRREVESLVFRPRAEVRRELGFSPSDVVVGFVGNLQNKRLEMLIEAVEFVHQHDSESRLKVLILGGPTKVREALATRAVASGVVARFVFHPIVDYRQVHHYLQTLDIGIIQYNRVLWAHLAIPQKIIDYLACGVPVLTRNFRERARLVRASGAGLV